MFSLKDIKLLSVYSSEHHNLLDDFYIPVLSVSKKYCRITGFFSSESLAVAAEGIGNLIKNKGEMKLITGIFSKKEDVLVAEDAMKNPDRIIKEMNLMLESEILENIFIKETIKAFGWMLANGLLEIRIAIPKREYVTSFSGLFHQKIGLISDSTNNKISFSGSINETGVAWLNNIEEFKVFRNWDDNERKYFESDQTRFFELWNNISSKVQVIPLPEAIEKKIESFAPKNIEHLNFEILNGNFAAKQCHDNSFKRKEIELRKYQQKALAAWYSSDFKGIIEMATGTGKTMVGVVAISEHLKLKNGLVIVSAPTREICDQWKNKIETFVPNDKIISTVDRNWKVNFENSLHEYEKNRLKNLILITTYDSLSTAFDFILKFDVFDVFLIADEVHAIGSQKRRQILNEPSFDKRIQYRLALSATPERVYDYEGTEHIHRFFGKCVFNYDIGKAIQDKVLCPYNYYLHFVEMSKEEFRNYSKLSKNIAKCHYSSLEDTDNEILTSLLNKRARIIKKSVNKKITLELIIKKLIETSNIKYTFLFCIDSKQLSETKIILDKFGLIYSQITGMESSNIERKNILKEFENGRIDLLLSMKILDEGLDVPNAKNAIILSSSTNPREYVQRRGRVLRKLKDEEKIANIYDFIVIPPVENNLKDIFEMERSIVKKELTRSFLFVKHSNNKIDIFSNKLLNSVIKKYDVGEIYDLLR